MWASLSLGPALPGGKQWPCQAENHLFWVLCPLQPKPWAAIKKYSMSEDREGPYWLRVLLALPEGLHWFPAPTGGSQLFVIPVQGVQWPLLASLGTPTYVAYREVYIKTKVLKSSTLVT